MIQVVRASPGTLCILREEPVNVVLTNHSLFLIDVNENDSIDTNLEHITVLPLEETRLSVKDGNLFAHYYGFEYKISGIDEQAWQQVIPTIEENLNEELPTLDANLIYDQNETVVILDDNYSFEVTGDVANFMLFAHRELEQQPKQVELKILKRRRASFKELTEQNSFDVFYDKPKMKTISLPMDPIEYISRVEEQKTVEEVQQFQREFKQKLREIKRMKEERKREKYFEMFLARLNLRPDGMKQEPLTETIEKLQEQIDHNFEALVKKQEEHQEQTSEANIVEFIETPPHKTVEKAIDLNKDPLFSFTGNAKDRLGFRETQLEFQ
jgi:hypothetical protein